MAETIESFVAKLRAEGVQAGQEAARKIRQQAEQEAESIRIQARQDADRIVADARHQAQEILSRGKTELELAARDTVLKLRDALNRVLVAVAARGAEAQLKDPAFLKGLLHDVVMLYARGDAEGRTNVEIRVAPEMQAQLADWAMSEMRADSGEARGVAVDLRATLGQAGFEYTTGGPTIEVTRASVAAMLSEMIGPELRKVVDQALGQKPKA
jgi:cell division septum initiation protein DivIVA